MDEGVEIRSRPDPHRETSEELMRKRELSVEEVAELFRLSPHVIRAAVRQHELPATLAGHNIVCIKRADLLAWMERRGGV